MKLTKFALIALAGFSILSTFAATDKTAEKDKDLYNFVVPTVSVNAKAAVTVEVKTEEKTEAPVATDIKQAETPKASDIAEKETKEATLVADAQLLIRDKLVQKYQIRLDEVIDNLSARLSTTTPGAQREALTELRKTISDRKALVVSRTELDPLKRDIIIAILDHVINRIDGIIKQSAQSDIGLNRG